MGECDGTEQRGHGKGASTRAAHRGFELGKMYAVRQRHRSSGVADFIGFGAVMTSPPALPSLPGNGQFQLPGAPDYDNQMKKWLW